MVFLLLLGLGYSVYKSAARGHAPLCGNPCPLIYIPDEK